MAAAVTRAVEAIVALERAIDPAEPLRFAIHRIASALAGPRPVAPLIDFLEAREPGSPRGWSRYRWELTHRVGVKHPPYAPSERTWVAWRAGDAAALDRDPFAMEARLLVPIVLVETFELLLETAAGGDELAARAQRLLAEAAPIARREIARYIAMNDPWEDTFALWAITRAPRMLDLMHSLAVALAVTYATGRQAPVRGIRFPYYDKPLASASAQLATALLTLGIDLEIAGELVRCVRDARRPSGGWGDDDDLDDPLTTLIAAELIARTDPSLELAPTIAYFERTQHADGLWRALGPDAPWLTGQIVALLAIADAPFPVRFRWPHCGRSLLDQKTGVPFFAHFIDLANLLAGLPGLAAAPVELAFIDLIGFRAFNNRHGQDAGDDVLRLFATHLKTVAHARAVRDGGDEFLVIGAPCRDALAADMRAFMASWTTVFRDRFGAETAAVAPRIIVGNSRGGELRALRQRLGREITALKELASVGEHGIIVEG